MIAANHVANASLYSKLPYDTVRDFRAIARIGQVPFVLCVHPSLPARSLKDFVALAKQRPGQINYSSPGNGTPGHLSMELLKTMAGIDVAHVPYKGAAQALTDMLGGQVPAGFVVIAAAIPQVNNGKLRPLAISSAKRSPQLPAVASFDELGYQGFDVVSWIGLAGPAGLPGDIVNKVSADTLKILQLADVRERIVAAGVEIVPAPADEFGAYIAKEHAKWGKLVKDSGAKLD
jgi:tripartite-type tricarboxylate transporter receptor subunit TctC